MLSDHDIKELLGIIDDRIDKRISTNSHSYLKCAPAIVSSVENNIATVRLASSEDEPKNYFQAPNKTGLPIYQDDVVWLVWFESLTNAVVMWTNEASDMSIYDELLDTNLYINDVENYATDNVTRINEALSSVNSDVARIEGILSSINLLHNWYFPNPVNQRGASGTITATGYFIDRWKLTSGSVTLESTGLTLNGTIVQISEYAWGTNVTASVRMVSGTATITYDNTTKTTTVTSSGGVIEAVKLEYGSVSTLANDAPPDYGEQLALCQRYFLYIPSVSVFTGIWGSTTQARLFIPLPVPMRIDTPTITTPSPAKLTCYTSSGNSTHTITGFGTGGAENGYLRAFATVSKPASVPAYTSVAFRNEYRLLVSAEL